MKRGFLGATQLLTIIPVQLSSPPKPAATVPWFPVVGALIGCAVGSIAAGSTEVVPASVAAGTAVIAGTVLTGAIHEDGLADTADALGGRTIERRREILKDSRLGSYGVIGMFTTIILRILCVATLNPAAAFAGLIAAHTLGRGAAVGVMATASELPDSGLGAEYARTLSRRSALFGVAAAISITVLATGWWAGPLVAIATIGAVIVSVVALRLFGAINGDILGAVEQVGECLVLIVVSGLAVEHQLWWA